MLTYTENQEETNPFLFNFVGLVWYAWVVMFGLVGLVWKVLFGRFGLAGFVW